MVSLLRLTTLVEFVLVFYINSVSCRINSAVNKESPQHWLNRQCFKTDVMATFQGDWARYVRLRRLIHSATYVPFASKDYLRLIHSLFRRENSELDPIDLNNLCIKWRWNLNKMELQMYALGDVAMFNCQANPSLRRHGRIQCKTKAYPCVSLDLVIADTDFDTYALIFGCLSDPVGTKFWVVVSNEEILTVDKETAILKKVTELGLSIQGILTSYETCVKNPNNGKRKIKFKRKKRSAELCPGGVPSPNSLGLLLNILHNDKCLRAMEGNADNVGKYELAKCDVKDERQWIRHSGVNSSMSTSNKQLYLFDNKGKCMNADKSFENGKVVFQSDCLANQENQFWSLFVGKIDDIFELESKSIRRCLTSAKDTDKGDITLARCEPPQAETPQQFWRIRPICSSAPPTITTRAPSVTTMKPLDKNKCDSQDSDVQNLKLGQLENVWHKGRCIRVVGESLADSARYELAICDRNDRSQLIRMNGQNTWSPNPHPLSFEFNGKCMSVDESHGVNGTAALQKDCSNLNNGNWLLVNGNFTNTFQLQSEAGGSNNRCLTPDPYTTVTPHNTLTIWACDSVLAQALHQYWRVRSTHPPCGQRVIDPWAKRCTEYDMIPISSQTISERDKLTFGLLENLGYKGHCSRLVGNSIAHGAKYELAQCSPIDRSQLIRFDTNGHFVPTKPEYLRLDLNGKCTSNTSDSIIPVVQWDCVNQLNQSWLAVNGDFITTFSLQNQTTHECLSAHADATVPIVTTMAMDLKPCHPLLSESPHQFWRVLAVVHQCGSPGGHDPIVTTQRPGPTTDSTITELTGPCNKQNTVIPNLKFALFENALHGDKCLRPVGGTADNGKSLELVPCSSADRSQWIRLSGANSWASDQPQPFMFDDKGKCLSAADDGKDVLQRDCSNPDNQLWSIIFGELLGIFQLKCKSGGKCITPLKDTHEGPLTLRACQPPQKLTPHQYWKIRPLCSRPTTTPRTTTK